MRFFQFKEYKPNAVSSPVSAVADIVQYLTRELKTTLRELSTGLQKLSLADNFESYIVTITIQSGQEVAIRHDLRATPTQRIIVRSDEGGLGIVDGDTEWTNQYVYLKNTSVSPGTVTVVFLA